MNCTAFYTGKGDLQQKTAKTNTGVRLHRPFFESDSDHGGFGFGNTPFLPRRWTQPSQVLVAQIHGGMARLSGLEYTARWKTHQSQ